MANQEQKQIPVCPSCGQPISFGFLRFKVGDKVKIALILFVIGYFILSLLVLVVISPAGLRKGCRRYDYIHQPDYCKDTEFKVSVRPLNANPALQVFVAGGLAAGVLLLYLDWLQNLYESWQRKRGKVVEKRKKAYQYKCRSCGREWG